MNVQTLHFHRFQSTGKTFLSAMFLLIVFIAAAPHLPAAAVEELDPAYSYSDNGYSAADIDNPDFKKAVFAGGCFWGVEYYMEQLDGVVNAVSGYTGGTTGNPSYNDVLSHTTGHVEAVEILYDPDVVSYEELARLFFEIHDPTQTDGQGPDIGEQYLSVIFYKTEEERQIANSLISILEKAGYSVATEVRPAAVFWPAEDYHQDYYNRKGSLPYCHGYVKRFPD